MNPEEFLIISDLSLPVLSTARMGALHGANRASILRVRVDGRGRQPPLLRLSLLQRDRRHHTHQARRRGE